MAQPVTAAQLRAVVERARKGGAEHELVLVQGAPDSTVDDDALGDLAGAVHATASPLHIRRLLHEAGAAGEPVVVITDLASAELGDELVVRSAGRRIWAPDRWEAVKSMFGVRSIAHDLKRHRHLADALIEGRPRDGYPPTRGITLDQQAALGALLKAKLDLSDAVTTLDRFLSWLDEAGPSAVKGVLDLSADLNVGGDLLFDDYLAGRFGHGGEGVRPVLAILRANKANSLMPLLFVAGVIHNEHEVDSVSAYKLQLDVNNDPFETEVWQHAAEAALLAASPDRLTDKRKRLKWSTAAQERLEAYEIPRHAERSEAIEAGFELRLAEVGRRLADAIEEPTSPAIAAAVAAAIADARAHWYSDELRVDRAEMAWRLIRRGNEPIAWGTRLSEAATAYRQDGAWLDRARNAIARGDSVPELAAVYDSIGASFTTSRHDDNRAFAKIAQSCAKALPDDVMGIEDIVRGVVAKAAKQANVLLLVFDGMGYESFTEVHRLFDQVGLSPYVDPGRQVARPCYAALPPVTEVSRTSLFAGEIRDGNQSSEVRAFRDLPELAAVSKSGNAPVVHHKAALRAGGIDSIPDNVLTDIRNDHQRVVAVVLNNIDERLKDVAGPRSSWGFDELHPLRWLLDEARANNRVVIATSDHGHILDRDAEQRTVTGAKERWRPADIEPADDEILVEGPRVVTGDQRAVLPFREQLHYDARRNGYHGGLCPQEVLVPVAVYAAADELLDSWSFDAWAEPGWWVGEAPAEDQVAAVEPAPKPKAKPPKGVAADALTLFESQEPEREDEAPAALAGSWVESTIAALAPYRRSQIRIRDDQLAALLGALERVDDQTVPLDRLADLTALPRHRMTGFVSQLQALVNIDGYSVLSVIGNEVRFERHLLDTQLGLG